MTKGKRVLQEPGTSWRHSYRGLAVHLAIVGVVIAAGMVLMAFSRYGDLGWQPWGVTGFALAMAGAFSAAIRIFAQLFYERG